MPRIFRQSPLNAIWEGSGNVICLDVLRAATKDPNSLKAVLVELELARGTEPRYDAYLDGQVLPALAELQSGGVHTARLAVGRVAVALQASLLLRHGDADAAAVFCGSRLGSAGRSEYGALDGSLSAAAAGLVARTTPVAA